MQLWLLVGKLGCPWSDTGWASLLLLRSACSQPGREWGTGPEGELEAGRGPQSFSHRYFGFVFLINQCMANFLLNFAVISVITCSVAEGP